MSKDNFGITMYDIESLIVEMDQNISRALQFMEGHFQKVHRFSNDCLKDIIELYISSNIMKECLEVYTESKEDFSITKEEVISLANLTLALKKLKLLLKRQNIIFETQ